MKETEIIIFMNSIRHVVKSLRDFSQVVERKHHISSAQLFIIHHLNDKKYLSINELAELSSTHQSSVSEVIKKLKTKNFVEFKKDQKDLRKKLITLTPLGRSLVKKAPITPQSAISDAFLNLAPKDQKLLSSLLSDVVSKAGLNSNKPTLFFEDKVEKD